MPKKEFTDISTDESGARELISFILYLFEADRPVPQTTLQRIFCAEKSHEAARKKLGRFCERAKMLGITIKKQEISQPEPSKLILFLFILQKTFLPKMFFWDL